MYITPICAYVRISAPADSVSLPAGGGRLDRRYSPLSRSAGLEEGVEAPHCSRSRRWPIVSPTRVFARQFSY
jgi:hypothetical protein